eukprot:TRINITY_DN16401_c0_g1_i3.p1 TRINITY_DN16401_c0_g1~~TRINITY_DN16401_c0_g1_i3.p1  ORF type:complete len:528 (+),score=140.05 TRINITY_DN16401_c0_g1_i3:2-1585(+)
MMNLNAIFEKEYQNLYSDSFDQAEGEIIRVVDDPITSPQLDKVIYINLENKNVNELTLIPIAKTLTKLGFHILSLNVSFNLLFNDSCVGYLEGVVRASPNLAYISLEKVGMTNQGAISLVNCLCSASTIRSINFGSNKLSEKVTEKFIAVFKKGKLLALESLNLSNIKMSEKSAISLLSAIIQHSQVVSLNLSANSLKYKTASHLLHLLSANPNAPLMYVDLAYNPVAKPLLNTIEEELQRRQAKEVFEENKTVTHSELEEIETIGEMPEETEDMDSDTEVIHKEVSQYKEVGVLGERQENSPLREVRQEEGEALRPIKEDAEDSREIVDENSPVSRKSLKGIINAKSKKADAGNFNIRVNEVKLSTKPATEYNENTANKNENKHKQDNLNYYEADEDCYNQNSEHEQKSEKFLFGSTSRHKMSPSIVSINKVEEAKSMVREHMQKLLEFYSSLDETVDAHEDVIESARRLIQRTPIPRQEKGSSHNVSAIELEVVKNSARPRPRFIKKVFGNSAGEVRGRSMRVQN